jgi:hypothetical protein
MEAFGLVMEDVPHKIFTLPECLNYFSIQQQVQKKHPPAVLHNCRWMLSGKSVMV